VPFLLRLGNEVVQGFRPKELVQIACKVMEQKLETQ